MATQNMDVPIMPIAVPILRVPAGTAMVLPGGRVNELEDEHVCLLWDNDREHYWFPAGRFKRRNSGTDITYGATLPKSLVGKAEILERILRSPTSSASLPGELGNDLVFLGKLMQSVGKIVQNLYRPGRHRRREPATKAIRREAWEELYDELPLDPTFPLVERTVETPRLVGTLDMGEIHVDTYRHAVYHFGLSRTTRQLKLYMYFCGEITVPPRALTPLVAAWYNDDRRVGLFPTVELERGIHDPAWCISSDVQLILRELQHMEHPGNEKSQLKTAPA